MEDTMGDAEEEGSWQVPKRSKIVSEPLNTPIKQPNFCSSNKFSPLHVPPENMTTPNNNDSQNNNNQNLVRPPPIFVKDVQNFRNFAAAISSKIGQDNFKCISKLNYVKVLPATSDNYRTLVSYLKSINSDFHTYQLKEDKPYRVVIRNLHHTDDPIAISKAIEAKGHKVLQVLNALHPVTKTPLPLFFVDIKQAPNNADIFKIDYLLNQVVRVEEPKPKRHIVQCLNCQEYGHTRRYCNHPSKCVKCGGSHDSSACTKTRESPAKCALCAGDHPANYRGCNVHQKLQQLRSQSRYGQYRRREEVERPRFPSPEGRPLPLPPRGISYAQAARRDREDDGAALQPNNLTSLITSTIQTVLQPLLSQLLTQLMDKLQSSLLTSFQRI